MHMRVPLGELAIVLMFVMTVIMGMCMFVRNHFMNMFMLFIYQ